MKNLSLLVSAFLVLVFTSCEQTPDGINSQFSGITIQQVEKIYDSLPDLAPLKSGEVNTLTNFKEDGKKITYAGETVLTLGGSSFNYLYGTGDMLLIIYDGQPVILYKNTFDVSVMRYDYSITGVKIKDNVIYIKGYRVDHEIFIVDVMETNKPNHEYVYGY